MEKVGMLLIMEKVGGDQSLIVIYSVVIKRGSERDNSNREDQSRDSGIIRDNYGV
jgi:hypothetical protein